MKVNRMSKILITGGAGFIGSAVCEKLSQLGHQVVAFDNFSRKSHLNINKNIETFNGDVRNLNDFNDCIKKYSSFDSLWHFAYINGTSTFYSNPELVLDVGVKGAINTLDVALQNNIKDYVLCSTSEVYNEPTQIPTPENERIIIPDLYNPRFSYSGGKIISELLTIHYGAKQGLNTKIFRPHNIYGPNMGFEHVIPEIIKKILLPEIPIYLDDRLVINIQGTGLETRSFCFIDDAIDEMALVGFVNDIDKSSIYNIGVQDEISIISLINLIADILNIDIIINSTETNPIGGTSRRCPSMKKLKSLGYQPQNSLHAGLQKTISWYKDYFLNKGSK
jgi:UDP-glucose 4-epimerase